MAEIESDLVKKYLIYQVPKKRSMRANNSRMQEGDHLRILTAVFDLFAKAKKKGLRMDCMTSDELNQAMAGAKSSYDAIMEIQAQINQAYQELIR